MYSIVIRYFIDYTSYKVIIKYWLYSLCCMLHPYNLFILYLVVCTSESPPLILPLRLPLSPLVTTNLFSRFMTIKEHYSLVKYNEKLIRRYIFMQVESLFWISGHSGLQCLWFGPPIHSKHTVMIKFSERKFKGYSHV